MQVGRICLLLLFKISFEFCFDCNSDYQHFSVNADMCVGLVVSRWSLCV